MIFMHKDLAVRITEIRQETPDTKTFRLDLSGKGFDFRPGQFIMAKVDMRETEDFKVLHGKDRTQSRAYSISSPPYEKDFIEITVKQTADGFVSKYFNQVMEVGDVIEITGPMGHFTIGEEDNVVLIGAGCGIAPFRSMLLEIEKKRLPINVLLLDSNKTPEDVLYYDELSDIDLRNDNIRVYFTITRPWLSDMKWDGPTGRIDLEAMKKHIESPETVTAYICGPPKMIETMETLLQEAGVQKDRIKSEKYGCA